MEQEELMRSLERDARLFADLTSGETARIAFENAGQNLQRFYGHPSVEARRSFEPWFVNCLAVHYLFRLFRGFPRVQSNREGPAPSLDALYSIFEKRLAVDFTSSFFVSDEPPGA